MFWEIKSQDIYSSELLVLTSYSKEIDKSTFFNMKQS
jgi:hypothetical protein